MEDFYPMYRFLDIFFSVLGLVFSFPLSVLIFTIIAFDRLQPLYYQKRLGQFQKPFILIKFRTMSNDTASLPTHLVQTHSITTFGGFLRKTKLDELPQLWNVIKGEMSLVGPRPCLPSQDDLIKEREKLDVFSVRPGITGLAQIRGIDMSRPELLAKIDAEMLVDFSTIKYFKYIFLTLLGKGSGDRIRRK